MNEIATHTETMRLASTYGVDLPSDKSTVPQHHRVVVGEDKYYGAVAVCNARKSKHEYDLTELLRVGQKLARFAVVRTTNSMSIDTVTIATKDTNLMELFGLVSGAPSRITLTGDRFDEVIEKLIESVMQKNTRAIVRAIGV